MVIGEETDAAPQEVEATWKTEPTKKTYKLGEDFAVSGTAQYVQDGKTKTIGFSKTLVTNGNLTVTGYDTSKLGTQTVTYTYENDEIRLVLTADITVKEAQAAPEGITSQDVQEKGGKGKISGLTSAMEYNTSASGGTWTTCPDGDLEIAAGTYFVRYKETETKAAGENTRVVIAKYVNKVPVIKEGKETIEAEVKAGDTYEINVDDVFVDPEGETMKLAYLNVKCEGEKANWKISFANSSKTVKVTPGVAGEVLTFELRASDTNAGGNSTETIKVTLTSVKTELQIANDAIKELEAYQTKDSVTKENVEQVKKLVEDAQNAVKQYLEQGGTEENLVNQEYIKGAEEAVDAYEKSIVVSPSPEPEKPVTPSPAPTTAPEAEKTETNLKDMRAYATATKKTVKLKWKKVSGADGYVIYGGKCGTDLKILATVKSGKKVTWSNKGLKKATSYQYYVKAYKMVNGQKVFIAQSNDVHVTTSGGKYTNVKSLKVSFKKATLKVGKTKKVKVKATYAQNGKKVVKHESKITYKSSNTKVATVNSKGKIKAVGKGTCKIYVSAGDGVYKTITVKVK